MYNVYLGYIIGVVVGDGFIDRYGVGLNAKDKDFVLEFKNNLEIVFNRKCTIGFYNNLWRAKLNCKEVVKFFKYIDYRDIETCTNLVKRAFLRGFFDSEGSAYFRAIPGVRNRKIEICNTNLELIRFCKLMMDSLEIKTRKIDNRTRGERVIKGRLLRPFKYFRLSLREGKPNLVLFKQLIGFSIERKNAKLNEIIDSYSEFKSKWKDLKLKALEFGKTKSKSEVVKKFNFIPMSTIYKWLQ